KHTNPCNFSGQLLDGTFLQHAFLNVSTINGYVQKQSMLNRPHNLRCHLYRSAFNALQGNDHAVRPRSQSTSPSPDRAPNTRANTNIKSLRRLRYRTTPPPTAFASASHRATHALSARRQ